MYETQLLIIYSMFHVLSVTIPLTVERFTFVNFSKMAGVAAVAAAAAAAVTANKQPLLLMWIASEVSYP